MVRVSATRLASCLLTTDATAQCFEIQSSRLKASH